MKLMFMLLPLVYLGGNAYLYWKTLQALASFPLWIRVLASVLFWALAFALFISVGLRESSLPSWMMKTLYVSGSVWMVFLLYSVLLLVLYDVAGIFIHMKAPGLFYVLPVTCCILICGYVNYRNPEVRNIDLVLDRSLECEELTAVVVSDVHLGYGTGVKALRRYVELITSQNPDVVFIAGDLIDNSLEPLVREPFAELLNSINAPQGIYMVPGNHEFISGIEACERYLSSQTSIHLLRDSLVVLPNGLQIIGRDDRSNRERKPLENLMRNAASDRPVLVLDHQPYELALTDSLGVDIQLSGHTHDGQIWPLNLLVDRMYEQGHGYRKWNRSHIYVSSGLSLWGPPFRIGTDSDMAVLKIRK